MFYETRSYKYIYIFQLGSVLSNQSAADQHNPAPSRARVRVKQRLCKHGCARALTNIHIKSSFCTENKLPPSHGAAGWKIKHHFLRKSRRGAEQDDGTCLEYSSVYQRDKSLSCDEFDSHFVASELTQLSLAFQQQHIKTFGLVFKHSGEFCVRNSRHLL